MDDLSRPYVFHRGPVDTSGGVKIPEKSPSDYRCSSALAFCGLSLLPAPLKPLETGKIFDGWIISGSLLTSFLFPSHHPLLQVALSKWEMFGCHTALTFERFVAVSTCIIRERPQRILKGDDPLLRCG